MNSLKGTRTEKNILTAFAGESQARNRYTFFAKQAKKEGFIQVSMAFTEAADNESQHAKTLFRFLEGGEVEITAAFPAGVIGKTVDNLRESAAGENHEHMHMYPDFAKIADEEGFPEIAVVMRSIARAEKQHEKRFLGFMENIENDTLYKKVEKVLWKCNQCGFIYEGYEPPEKCPACAHPSGYFEVLAENW